MEWKKERVIEREKRKGEEEKAEADFLRKTEREIKGREEA